MRQRDIVCCQESQEIKITECLTASAYRRGNVILKGKVALSVKTQIGQNSLTPSVSSQSYIVSPFYGTVAISVRRCS